MTSAFPPRNRLEYDPRERADLTVSGDSRVDALDALSSGTAQSILGALDGDPKTTSEIAEVVDTSIQNVHHHLRRLEEHDFVEPIGTRYSVKGREMTVYALAAEKLVVQFGAAEQSSD
ncbi:ArsR family transcriptional regulator [Haloplanus salinus]|mgnify:FL=1|jgi:DNA-binding transcriptional ArsR family regulator|uniref:ArsR family transcriptional regulator n=1 Tax=Haloplanus salinus TaxID=1126245 RepID=A0A368N7V1_9EURY|nr:helix-turn-helix domain-containing protein [Haloplanus salinus]RCU46602.1 ArsR family transcriptional regulator [Haloplanus salinus]